MGDSNEATFAEFRLSVDDLLAALAGHVSESRFNETGQQEQFTGRRRESDEAVIFRG